MSYQKSNIETEKKAKIQENIKTLNNHFQVFLVVLLLFLINMQQGVIMTIYHVQHPSKVYKVCFILIFVVSNGIVNLC